MKNTNKKILIASLLGIASIATIGSTLAFNPQGQSRLQLDDASRTAIHEAVLNGDYTSFQALTTDLSNRPNLSKEQFENYSKRLIERGGEIGSMRGENRMGNRDGDREERRAEMAEKREEMIKVMDEGDFDARKEIAPEHMLEIIDTDEEFDKLLEAHEHMQAAREIREELGLPEMRMNMHSQNNGNTTRGQRRMK